MKTIKTFFLKHFEGSLILLIILGILAIAFLVHFKFVFLNFFFLPVILAGYFLGKKEAVLISILSILLVLFYLLFSKILAGAGVGLSLDEGITLVTWSSFLILIAAMIGTLSEQRETRMKNLYSAYIGVLEILLKYLEVADEKKPRSVRIAHRAGKMAGVAGLDKRQVENIKSAALLFEAGDLQSNLPLFDEISEFMGAEGDITKSPIGDREKVLLQTTTSLLKDVEPILSDYYRYYVQDADKLDKNLSEIPVGSSILALADIYDRIENKAPPFHDLEEYSSLKNILSLSGRTFHEAAVNALQIVVTS
ncbi:MAG: hypothetical protein KAT01_04050 [Candidatus Aminicenantes bacterium]|nr:hypothetical protein [Candidatus Aminicenantes bacterium]